MNSSSHLFCPKSGSLLMVDADKGVLACTSSGYSRHMSGAQSQAHKGSLYPLLIKEDVTTSLSSLIDLADVVIRKEVDMGDFLRRYDLTPLVQAEKLDAGKRVLQRVRFVSFRCLCTSLK